jgi:hypothetical protein
MRPPPPVLPSCSDASGPEQSWLQRQGADAGLSLHLTGWLVLLFVAALGVGFLAAKIHGLSGASAFALALVVATVLTGGAGFFIRRLSTAAGAGALALVMPSGESDPYAEQFSFQESMAARGDVAGALESYEAIIAERPTAVLPRVRAAELRAKNDRDPTRAVELFRSVRDLPTASRSDVLYASNRLVDLYLGPIGDLGRAQVELRRIIERFPGTPAATRSREALAAIKAQIIESLPDA